MMFDQHGIMAQEENTIGPGHEPKQVRSQLNGSCKDAKEFDDLTIGEADSQSRLCNIEVCYT